MLLLKISQSVASRGYTLSHVCQHAINAPAMAVTRHFSCQRRRVLALRHKFLASVSRLFSRNMPRLPLDAESLSAVITSDVTVFTYKNSRFYLLLTIFGGTQFIFWANLAIFIKSDPTVQKSGKSDTALRKTDSSRMGKFYADNQATVATACICLGSLALFFAMSYPMRSVSSLTLLKGGKELGVTTYWHFGRTRYFTVPLDDVSCTRSRLSSKTNVAMKIRGRWMYFLLDTRDGRFHEPELFDYVIGLNRSFK